MKNSSASWCSRTLRGLPSKSRYVLKKVTGLNASSCPAARWPKISCAGHSCQRQGQHQIDLAVSKKREMAVSKKRETGNAGAGNRRERNTTFVQVLRFHIVQNMHVTTTRLERTCSCPKTEGAWVASASGAPWS